MTAPFSPGAIRIGVETDADGRVTSAALLSGRPVGFGRLFIGKPGSEAPMLARQLFSLCGYSHGAAARLALAAASRQTLTPSQSFSIAVGLATELIVESLRSTALGWPRVDGGDHIVLIASPLREAMHAAQVILAAATRGDALAQRGKLLSSARAIGATAKALGLTPASPATPEAGSPFAQMIEEAAADDVWRLSAPDPLLPANDGEVVAALQRSGEDFGGAPALAARVIETGACARRWRDARQHRGMLAARLAARFIVMAETLRDLENMLRDGAETGEAASFASCGAGEGYAAVETARGRLYHLARVDAQARICGYALLAPTEWNFHPAGPFIATLLGATIGAGDNAHLRVRRLAAVFDPCVAFHLELRERGHA